MLIFVYGGAGFTIIFGMKPYNHLYYTFNLRSFWFHILHITSRNYVIPPTTECLKYKYGMINITIYIFKLSKYFNIIYYNI